MSDFIETLIGILLAILLFLGMIGIFTLIFWGLGNLVIWAFKIDFTWEIWHGLVVAIIYMILRGIFSKD